MLADATQCYTMVHYVRPSYLVLHPIRKKLRRDLSTLFPASERLLPPKCSLVTARLVTHGGDTVTVFMVDGEPLFFDDDGTIFPTGMYHTWMHGLSNSNWYMTDEFSTFWHFFLFLTFLLASIPWDFALDVLFFLSTLSACFISLVWAVASFSYVAITRIK